MSGGLLLHQLGILKGSAVGEQCCRPGLGKLYWLAGSQKGFCRSMIKSQSLKSVPGNLPAPRAGPEYQVFTQTHESFKVKNAMTCSQ